MHPEINLVLFLKMILLCTVIFVLFCFPCSRLQLETDLKIEKEWRQTLEDDLQKEKETVSHLRTETQEIVNLKKVNSGANFY